MFNQDRFKIGDGVRIVRTAEPHLKDAKAVIVEARRWRTAHNHRTPNAPGYQLYSYAVATADGRRYAAEECTLEPWTATDPQWTKRQRDEKIDWKEFRRAIGWAPKVTGGNGLLSRTLFGFARSQRRSGGV